MNKQEIYNLIETEFINWLKLNREKEVGIPNHSENCLLTRFLVQHGVTPEHIYFDYIFLPIEDSETLLGSIMEIPPKINKFIRALVYDEGHTLNPITGKQALEVWSKL